MPRRAPSAPRWILGQILTCRRLRDILEKSIFRKNSTRPSAETRCIQDEPYHCRFTAPSVPATYTHWRAFVRWSRDTCYLNSLIYQNVVGPW